MNSRGVIAVESIDKEVRRIERKFTKLTSEDKAGRVFVVAGVILIGIGLIGVKVVYVLNLPLIIFFLLGFLFTEMFVMGFSLMHKSLRGSWL